ncbi:MAG: MATE family efflux transporter [Dysosmobacter welbionis]
MATICLNQAARTYGDAAIAAMGVVQRIMMFGGSAMIGFGQGFQPVCGFNYGAGLYHRVKEGFWFSVKVTFVLLLAVSAAGFACAPQLVSIFRDDPEVIAIGTAALRFQCVTFFQAWITMSNMMLQTIGRTVPATFVAMARQGIFFIPLVWLLSLSPLGLLGVQMAQSVSDLLTLAAAVPIQLYVLRQMSQMQPAKV